MVVRRKKIFSTSQDLSELHKLKRQVYVFQNKSHAIDLRKEVYLPL